MKLKNRTAIITGAARGIGLSCAERFVAEGARVLIADVLDDVGMAEASRLGAAYLHCDVSNSSEVKTTVAAVVKQFGAVDILVNNAGISIPGDFLEMSEADYDRVIDINLKGSFLMLQACAREMVKQVAAGKPPGAIINMSSVNDTLAIPDNRQLLHRQGWRLPAHPRNLHIARPAWHPRQCHRPRFDHDRHAAKCGKRQGRHGARHVAHSHGPRRRALGDCLHRRVPGFR